MFKKNEIVRLRAADLQFALEAISFDDRGELICAILYYLENGNFPEKVSVETEWCFYFLKEQLDRDNEKLTDSHPLSE